jgi:predicted outer membrane repeat protein
MNTKTKQALRRTAVAAGTALVVLLAVAAGLGMLASAAPAASLIYVRKNGDDANCDGTVNVAYPGGGPGLQCAVKTIQKGIELVDPGGTVIVAGGVYAENVNIPKDLTLQGAGAGSTIIDAGSVGRGIHVDLSVDTTVSGVTIRNGSAGYGAGINVTGSGAFTLTGSTVSNNTCSGGDGAGLYLGSGTTAFISGCTFENNSSDYGGAISSHENTLTIVGSTFSGNEATGGGGAIYNSGASGSLTLIESTISSNAVTGQGGGEVGGGIAHYHGTLAISNTTITNNTTTWAGGGVSLGGGTARIVGSAIAGNSGNNTTSCLGGGVYNTNSTLTIEDSVVRGNWVSATLSSQGGGIWSAGRATLNRVTVSGNSSTGYAGGIFSSDALTMTNVTVSGNASFYIGGLSQTSGAVGTLTNCTIVNNTANLFGGGIRAYSTVNLANTLLANNANGNCSIGSSGTMNSGGHNLEDGDSCNLGGTGDMTNTDPLIAPLLGFGPSVGAPGSQEKMGLHALSWGSPAIDAFDSASCPAVDQRGVTRPVDGDGDGNAACDIGAFEFDLLNSVFLPLVLREY